ncbi:MAG TPA: hypothetical protein VJJ53_03365 [Candidatus Nanoarchaeia archaeon]|nr:hypothetical protein [Candidatus Nanoarchaeia archaeon]
MKRGFESNLQLVIILVIALLLIIWGVSFIIESKQKQEGLADKFSEGLKGLGNTFYESDFLTSSEESLSYFSRSNDG